MSKLYRALCLYLATRLVEKGHLNIPPVNKYIVLEAEKFEIFVQLGWKDYKTRVVEGKEHA